MKSQINSVKIFSRLMIAFFVDICRTCVVSSSMYLYRFLNVLCVCVCVVEIWSGLAMLYISRDIYFSSLEIVSRNRQFGARSDLTKSLLSNSLCDVS